MENNSIQYEDRKEVERVILSAIISDGDLSPAVSRNIGQEYFGNHSSEAEFIWNRKQESGAVPTPKTIKKVFKGLDLTPPANNAEIEEAAWYLKQFHAKDLLNKQLLELRPKLSSNNPDGWREILMEWPEKFANIQNIMNSTRAKDFAGDALERYKYVQKRGEQREEGSYRVNFAHEVMNEHFGGYEPGFYLYVARTGKGKTWTCLLDLWWTWYAGRLLDKPVNVGLFSLEMDINKVGLRLDTFESKFSNYDLNRGLARKNKEIEDEEILEQQAIEYKNYIERLAAESEEGKRGKFKIWTREMLGGNVTPSRIEALIKEEDLDFVVVDQLELVDANSGTADERAKLNETSLAFKKMSGMLNIPILVPHQMNRETIKTKEVTDANVAGSDGPARHAEFVCYLERDKTTNVMSYNFLKSRNAPIDKKFYLKWDWDTGVYSVCDIDEETMKVHTDTMQEDMDYLVAETSNNW